MVTKHPETQMITEDAIFKFSCIVSWAISWLKSGPQVLEASALTSVSTLLVALKLPPPAPLHFYMRLYVPQMPSDPFRHSPHHSLFFSHSKTQFVYLCSSPPCPATVGIWICNWSSRPIARLPATPFWSYLYTGDWLVKGDQGQSYRVEIQKGAIWVGGENGIPPPVA